MNIKEIVNKYWKDFEIIAFNAVKNELPQEFISKEIITQSVKDGGYDGEIILISPNGEVKQILIEAKLRSYVYASLPLQDFAKSLVVAIVKQSDKIYIVTNLHFSKKTIELLEKYSNSAKLDIELLNGKSIKDFVNNNDSLLDEVSTDLKIFISEYTQSSEEQKLIKKDADNFGFYDEHCDYSDIIELLNNRNGIQIVTGHYGSGKTYYIEKLSKSLNAHGINIKTIDLSMHLSYRSFFLELLEKSFGLSLELFDIAGNDIFDTALNKIINTDNKNDEINMLKHIYSKIDNLPYDYSVIFKLMIEFYKRIYNKKINKSPFIIAFENLVYAPKEVLQLLQCLINSDIKITCIIELTTDDYCASIKADEWETIKHNIIDLSKFKQKQITSWDKAHAKVYLRDNINDINDFDSNKIIEKFGANPMELSKLITFINNDRSLENLPRELLINHINMIDLSNNLDVYCKCFANMIYQNSNILYIFMFLYFLNGKVDETLLSKFFNDQSQLIQCHLIISKCNLFIINQNKQFKSHIIKKNFDEYCKTIFNASNIKEVIKFIEANIKNIHLSKEIILEYQVKKNFFFNEYDYIISLIELGNEYLKLNNLKTANEKFNETLKVINNSFQTIKLSTVQNLQLYIGLVETDIWKIGQMKEKIEKRLNSIKKIIENSTSSSLDYQLLILRYYILRYQFYHTQSNNKEAFTSAKEGVEWINKYNLYSHDLENCGKIWRFYAIATKEINNDIYKCLDIFEKGSQYCAGSAKFLFGKIIHENMIIDTANYKERLKSKLTNYNALLENDSKLSIDEHLHYKVNIAALHFLQKDYNNAEREYVELLKESDIFNITREKTRILNDMANLCWINKDYGEARKKFYNAKKTAELSGCIRNHWPILVNLVSFEIFNRNYSIALNIHYELLPVLLKECDNLIQGKSGFEKTNYCMAAFIIHLKNLLKIYDNLERINKKQLFIDMTNLLNKSNFFVCNKNDNFEKIKKVINKLSLKDSEYDHNGLFLIKD